MDDAACLPSLSMAEIPVHVALVAVCSQSTIVPYALQSFPPSVCGTENQLGDVDGRLSDLTVEAHATPISSFSPRLFLR